MTCVVTTDCRYLSIIWLDKYVLPINYCSSPTKGAETLTCDDPGVEAGRDPSVSVILLGLESMTDAEWSIRAMIWDYRSTAYRYRAPSYSCNLPSSS